MKQHTALLGTSLLAVALALAPALAHSDSNGGIQTKSRLLLGTNSLESDWGIHDEQGVIGFITDIKGQHWPLAVAVDAFGAGNESKRDGRNNEAYVASIHLGARLQWDGPGHWAQPYIGGGIALANAETKPDKTDDSGIGYWLGVGADIPLNERFSLGLDLRYSEVDVDLDNATFSSTTLNAGGTQFGLTLGYRW